MGPELEEVSDLWEGLLRARWVPRRLAAGVEEALPLVLARGWGLERELRRRLVEVPDRRHYLSRFLHRRLQPVAPRAAVAFRCDLGLPDRERKLIRFVRI